MELNAESFARLRKYRRRGKEKREMGRFKRSNPELLAVNLMEERPEYNPEWFIEAAMGWAGAWVPPAVGLASRACWSFFARPGMMAAILMSRL